MSKPTIIKTIELRTERNTRMQSYKGKWNCEIFINGTFAGDAQGDTSAQARNYADAKVRGWERDGLVVRGK